MKYQKLSKCLVLVFFYFLVLVTFAGAQGFTDRALFENAVVSEIKKQCLFMPTPPSIYHWRAHSGAECDLILERDGRFYPIEIKAKTRPSRSDAKGIATFRKEHHSLNVFLQILLTFFQSLQSILVHFYCNLS